MVILVFLEIRVLEPTLELLEILEQVLIREILEILALQEILGILLLLLVLFFLVDWVEMLVKVMQEIRETMGLEVMLEIQEIMA